MIVDEHGASTFFNSLLLIKIAAKISSAANHCNEDLNPQIGVGYVRTYNKDILYSS